jgi:putative ABC transport system substrate-binding protein
MTPNRRVTWQAAAAWPLAARAQESERIQRIGVLMAFAEDDPEAKARLAAFRQGLEKRGWSEGLDVRIDARFAPAGTQAQVLAKELVALQPDVILAHSTPVTAALQRESRTIPIVFAVVADPIGSGFIASLPRPGGNITGVMQYRHRQVAGDAQGGCARPCARRLRGQPQDGHLL